MSKDRKTKFRINAFSSKKRSYEQGAKKVYADIKKRFYDQFLKAKKEGKKFDFRTDKLEHYKKGFKKYFCNVATLTFGVPIKCKKYGLKRNNNCIERDHQYSRKLEKNSRGNKDSDGISAVFDLADAYYNYIDKQRLRKKSRKEKKWVWKEKRWRTPAERAKIKIKLGDKYSLLNLIKKVYAED
ncbi:DDE-type integrase/transposase/recombinase [Candidatus Woesearchaeota archaeon]|nr:DDE-type integrase/transposase/recombinase [Candidatus Woesearchaeota archaeon]